MQGSTAALSGHKMIKSRLLNTPRSFHYELEHSPLKQKTLIEEYREQFSRAEKERPKF